MLNGTIAGAAGRGQGQVRPLPAPGQTLAPAQLHKLKGLEPLHRSAVELGLCGSDCATFLA